MTRYTRLLGAMALAAVVAGCAAPPPPPAPSKTAVRLDDTPRIAVISAFAPELTVLLPKVQQPVKHSVNGVDFTTGTLEGKPVVVFLSGISMTNAAMNTQLVLDRFNVSHIVFSGIAGGVNLRLHIGDVTVPAQWGQYMEWLMAREDTPGQYSAPVWMKSELTMSAFGMMHPRPVEVRSAANPQLNKKFWFEADPKMLATARSLQNVGLEHCLAATCLKQRPQLVVGGSGVSGQAFVDNKAFREYAFKTFEANVLDMETAATAMVAHSNGVPYIAFRSLSDLAGGGDGENEMGTFMGLAAANSAKVLQAFLASWK
ncbi:adenosylhomocysteine nucleosidase [Acidovorax sp. 69]|uniref:5'-methylthioadenosine/S-adenosylhomocysteine nucleosidase n=1 Tax=Acidovorax sp. 69 TaxID=2035202 RepID=UPI000C23D567|nr:5'-methylthioadenosine/S-adenosylhomocysteine nucleosidase [Acidovorax sp. 69]PJI97411.1 adenosylhomocysteine nucleosidase [Acidovorax sp. 69]